MRMAMFGDPEEGSDEWVELLRERGEWCDTCHEPLAAPCLGHAPPSDSNDTGAIGND